MAERKLKIIVDQLGDAGPGLLSLKGGLASLGGVAAGVATAGLAVAGAGVLALGAGLFTSVDAAMEAQAGQAELQAVLESTKGVAGVTADAVNDLASKFQDLTMFEDDAILAGENMLLTFTNIGKDVFPMATESMLNLAQKFGSMDQASTMLGKALNDPVAGVSALRRVGIQLTEAQEESIKKFVEMGDVASAQKVILAEVETQVGGLAEAAGATLPGRLAILKNTFGDIQETIGAAFLPALTTVADALAAGLKSEMAQSALASLTEFITGTVAPGIETIVFQVGNIISAFSNGGLLAAFAVFEDGSSRVGALAEVFGLTEEAGMALGVAVQSVAQFVTDALAIWNEWSSHLSETTGPAMLLIQDALDRIAIATGGATGEFSLSRTLLAALKATLDAVTVAIKLVALAFQVAAAYMETWAKIIRTVKTLGGQIGSIYTGAMNSIKSAINSVIGKWNDFKNAVKSATDAIPDWLIPGSPTPFEVGMRGIANAASSVAGAMPAAFAGAGGQGSALAGVGGQGPGAGGMILNFTYAPVISLADRYEAQNVLAPFIAEGVRKALGGKSH